jgi:hypothetical protein
MLRHPGGLETIPLPANFTQYSTSFFLDSTNYTGINAVAYANLHVFALEVRAAGCKWRQAVCGNYFIDSIKAHLPCSTVL